MRTPKARLLVRRRDHYQKPNHRFFSLKKKYTVACWESRHEKEAARNVSQGLLLTWRSMKRSSRVLNTQNGRLASWWQDMSLYLSRWTSSGTTNRSQRAVVCTVSKHMERFRHQARTHFFTGPLGLATKSCLSHLFKVPVVPGIQLTINFCHVVYPLTTRLQ